MYLLNSNNIYDVGKYINEAYKYRDELMKLSDTDTTITSQSTVLLSTHSLV